MGLDPYSVQSPSNVYWCVVFFFFFFFFDIEKQETKKSLSLSRLQKAKEKEFQTTVLCDASVGPLTNHEKPANKTHN